MAISSEDVKSGVSISCKRIEFEWFQKPCSPARTGVVDAAKARYIDACRTVVGEAECLPRN